MVTMATIPEDQSEAALEVDKVVDSSVDIAVSHSSPVHSVFSVFVGGGGGGSQSLHDSHISPDWLREIRSLYVYTTQVMFVVQHPVLACILTLI